MKVVVKLLVILIVSFFIALYLEAPEATIDLFWQAAPYLLAGYIVLFMLGIAFFIFKYLVFELQGVERDQHGNVVRRQLLFLVWILVLATIGLADLDKEYVGLQLIALVGVLVLGLVVALYYRFADQAEALKNGKPGTPMVLPPPATIDSPNPKWAKDLKVPPQLVDEIVGYRQYFAHDDPEAYVRAINTLAVVLPPAPLLVRSSDGVSWGSLLDQEPKDTPAQKELEYKQSWLKGAVDYIRAMRFRIEIPESIRNEHMHILAGTGHGKTTLLEGMIKRDLDLGVSVVLIDSQEQLIPKLLKVVPSDRLVYIDPTDWPPAINLFAGGSTDLFEYIFSAFETKLTAKQRTVYRNVAKLCMALPNATIRTMHDILKNGAEPYLEQVELDDVAEEFFRDQYNNRKLYGDTRVEVSGRLDTLLENQYFARMFSVTENKIDVGKLLDEGKVILVNTAKSVLKGASQIYGRFWIAQVANAVTERTGAKHRRAYLYIDEVYDYLSESDDRVLTDLFTQARKRELGIIVAHQQLSQLPTNIEAAIHTNTAVKAVGGLSAKDSATMAKEMRTIPEKIDSMKIGEFLIGVKHQKTCVTSTSPGELDRLVSASTVNLERLRAEQRRKYRVAVETLGEYFKRKLGPPSQGGIVDESGDWPSK